MVGYLLSFAVCFAAMPAVIGLSWRIGAVDTPRDWRRMHRKPTPRAGGVALLFGFVVSCLSLVASSRSLRCALVAGVLMLLLGLCDDIWPLDAWVKLFFQIAIAGAAVVGSGVTRPISILLSVLWVVTLCNAHNMIDGLDGLFGGCASIEGIALAIALWVTGEGGHAAVLLCLAGGCMGFLCFNRCPARIFAGDCGSGTVGFLLGLLSLPLMRQSGTGGVFPALLIFGYPLTDLLAAVVRRVLRGQSPFAADRGHLHHRVCATGMQVGGCVGVFWLISFSLSLLGVLLLREHLLPLSSLVCMANACLLIALRRFILKFS